MTTRAGSKSSARHQLEAAHRGPLTLAALIGAIREGEGWSLADMAKRLKVTRGHVAALEAGKAVSPQSAAKYARALGYGQEQFVRLAIQDELRRAHLPYVIEVSPQRSSSPKPPRKRR